MYRFAALCGACIAAQLLLGCANEPLTLSPGAAAQSESRLARITCRVDVARVWDSRPHPETLGNIAGRAVRAPEDSRLWLTNGLGYVSRQGVELVAAPNDLGNKLALEAELKEAWVASMSTSKIATAVVRVRYTRSSGGELVEKIYRGRTTSLNWASGDAEITGMMQEVFMDISKQIAPDVHSLCQ